MRKYYKHNELKYEILKYLEKHPGATTKEIAKAVSSTEKNIQAILWHWCRHRSTYVTREWVIENKCGKFRYYLSDRGRYVLNMLKRADRERKMGLRTDLKLKKLTVP